MKYNIIPDEDALKNCTWCGSKINEFDDVFSVDSSVKPGIELQKYQSHCIQIDLISQEKTLNAMVAADDSEAKADGKDLMFLVCSKTCQKALNNALIKETASGGVIEKV